LGALQKTRNHWYSVGSRSFLKNLPPSNTMRRHLPGLTHAELSMKLGSVKRATETLKWLERQSALPLTLPARIETVSQRAWSAFVAEHRLVVPRVHRRTKSEDGTVKLALDFSGDVVETVMIPAERRSTICISSQVGCTRKCVFCATKELGFTRQLLAEEMVAQYLLARHEAPAERPAVNVVFMGMGEPFDNLDEVLRAVQCLTQGPFPQLKRQCVTVSTSGVAPAMKRFLAECDASLALSLNATTDAQRFEIMPQTKVWPIESLLEVLRDDAKTNPKRSTLIEYVLIDQFNDSDADADRLVQLCRGFHARVNVIPYNPYPGTALKTPPAERVVAFSKRVADQGQLSLVRWPRGKDVAAACGQLALTESARESQFAF
jgi:23S rRNA (adenine2503-C2)-methyltransferase